MSLLISLNLQRENFLLSINGALDSDGFSAIYGPSGSGKTTLLRWIAGLEEQSQGHLTFKGDVWHDENNFVPPQKRQIAYVFQDSRLFPHLDVQGNLEYAYKRRFNDNGPCLSDVTEWLELTSLLSRYSSQLSGGQQQRVAIARALLSSPQLILMDEPLGSLDPAAKQRIIKHLETLQHKLSVPVLYVSHDLEEVSRLADQLILLDNGQVISQGSLLDLSTRLDLSLSHQENAFSVIEATVVAHDLNYQLTELLINGQLSLFVAAINNNIGDCLRVRIPARDVSIALTKPDQSSILNILPATIEDIENTDGARVLIRLLVADQILLVRLTRKSVAQLQLHIGQSVFAQIKTVALLSDRQYGENSQP